MQSSRPLDDSTVSGIAAGFPSPAEDYLEEKLDLNQRFVGLLELFILEVEDIWGVGPAYSRFLRNNNIHTALTLRDADLS